MSSFNKASNRKSSVLDNNKIKKHVSAVYKIIAEVDALAIKIIELNLEVTNENINEVASDIIGRDLDSMERFLLMGKLEAHVKQSNG